jgi:O-antigen ligase
MVGYSSGASRLRSWQLYPIVLFLFLALLLTGGRTSFVSMLLVVSFFILRAFSEDTGQKKVSLAIASVIMLLIMLATSQYENHYVHSESHDSWERSSLWKSAIDANDSFLFGVGTGDYKKELNSYFHKHGMEEFEKGSFNAHNEFIHTYLANGVAGLLAFVFLIAHPLYMAVRRGSAMGVLVFFPFIIYAMTEVFLGRLQGVAFFGFIHQAFVSHFDSMQRTAILKA